MNIQSSGDLVKTHREHRSKNSLELGDDLLVVGDSLTMSSFGLPGFHILDDLGEHPNLMFKLLAVTGCFRHCSSPASSPPSHRT